VNKIKFLVLLSKKFSKDINKAVAPENQYKFKKSILDKMRQKWIYDYTFKVPAKYGGGYYQGQFKNQ